MIRGPKWRTRTSPVRRARAAVFTTFVVVVTGMIVMGVVMWLLALLGAPRWVVALPWIVPTLGAMAWVLIRPRPAVATDDDDDGWVGYAIEYVVVGENEPRPAPVRLLAALLLGAPIVWSLTVFGLSILVGVF